METSIAAYITELLHAGTNVPKITEYFSNDL